MSAIHNNLPSDSLPSDSLPSDSPPSDSAAQLAAIVGASAICAWKSLPAEQQIQIRAAISPEAAIDWVVYPQTEAALATVIACAHQNRWRVLPCGNGSKLHWGGLAAGIDLVVSTARLNRLVEHAVGDLTVTAEAGMRFAELQAILARQGQFLAIDPSYPDNATLGGIVATADTNSLRQRYGGVRDLLIGISFVRSDGQIAKAGGRVVKNVAGYDLMKLLTGSWGTLGILTQVTLRIYPLAAASQTIVLTGTAETIAAAAQALSASALTPIAADILAPQTLRHLQLGQGMGLVTQFRSIAVSVEEQANALIQLGTALNLKSIRYADQDEVCLWQALAQRGQAAAQTQSVTCKIGVVPASATATLEQISAIVPSLSIGLIHLSSGLGRLQFEADSIDLLLKLRHLCQSAGGFLTVLAAPQALKQFDLWGYSGNALPLMQQLKHQFDPDYLLSPHRFVGGI
jgi:glycolate oxidase FAD binding subunit